MEPRDAAAALETWFQGNGRALPWRGRHDPYEVLVAEFILQQTRMETGIPRFHSFVKRFPTLASLARARESSVLAEWSGLGYYARARNLRRCAQVVMERHGGRIPSDPAQLRGLPGVGPYTAGAIASIAFDRPEPSLDGNQYRVYGRLLKADPAQRAGRRQIEAFARALLVAGSPRTLNQAVMDLGSQVCRPSSPTCAACPLRAGCATKGAGPWEKRDKKPSPVEHWEALVYVRHGQVWLAAPRGEGLLGSHWLPPLRRGRARPEVDLTHTFSHREWRLRWVQQTGTPRGPGRWVGPDDLRRLPHGPLTKKFVSAALASDYRTEESARTWKAMAARRQTRPAKAATPAP